MNKGRKNKKGFTLIEMLLVLGLAAVVMIAAFGVYTMVMAEVRAARAASEFRGVAASTVRLFSRDGGVPDFTGVSNQVLRNANIIPDSWTRRGNQTLINSYGQTLLSSQGNEDSMFFDFSGGNMSEGDCVRFFGNLYNTPLPNASLWVQSGTRAAVCIPQDGAFLPGWGVEERTARIYKLCEGGENRMRISVGHRFNRVRSVHQHCERYAMPID